METFEKPVEKLENLLNILETFWKVQKIGNLVSEPIRMASPSPLCRRLYRVVRHLALQIHYHYYSTVTTMYYYYNYYYCYYYYYHYCYYN